MTMVNKGDLFGTVSAADGTHLPGVLITVAGTQTNEHHNVVSNIDGQFRLMALPPGTYNATFSLEGFKTVSKKGIEIDAGEATTLEITMELEYPR